METFQKGPCSILVVLGCTGTCSSMAAMRKTTSGATTVLLVCALCFCGGALAASRDEVKGSLTVAMEVAPDYGKMAELIRNIRELHHPCHQAQGC